MAELVPLLKGCSTMRSNIDRGHLVSWYGRNRARSQALFDIVTPQAYYSRPIALRHPLVFYEGHLPAFSFNTLVKRGLGRPSLDPRLERLFARGIDPHESQAAGDDPESTARLWPSRKEVQQFAAEADRQVLEALAHGEIEREGDPLLHRGEAAYCILEHEAMHQETLLYMWHRLPLDQKRAPATGTAGAELAVPNAAHEVWIDIPEGRATLGADPEVERFTWDNERRAHTVDVPAFRIARYDVTNGAFTEFVEAGGYRDQDCWAPDDWVWVQQEGLQHPLFWERDEQGWWWRGMFARVPLPADWPVYVSHAEASAYARWRGFRLPTESEYHRAAFGTPAGDERRHPWGNAPIAPQRGVFDFARWDPAPVGSHPEGDSAWGVADLVGNGWEWTTTPFAPFAGFSPMPSYPEYSAEFFDGEHAVMKGASPATAAELVRPSFRNWFRRRYPYMYATFRLVDVGAGR